MKRFGGYALSIVLLLIGAVAHAEENTCEAGHDPVRSLFTEFPPASFEYYADRPLGVTTLEYGASVVEHADSTRYVFIGTSGVIASFFQGSEVGEEEQLTAFVQRIIAAGGEPLALLNNVEPPTNAGLFDWTVHPVASGYQLTRHEPGISGGVTFVRHLDATGKPDPKYPDVSALPGSIDATALSQWDAVLGEPPVRFADYGSTAPAITDTVTLEYLRRILRGEENPALYSAEHQLMTLRLALSLAPATEAGFVEAYGPTQGPELFQLFQKRLAAGTPGP